MGLLRLVTVMVTALSMSLSFSHLLQLPPRMSFDGPTWITTQQVFPLYGSVGAVLEIGSVALAGALAYAVRRRPSFVWTLAGALCLAAALVVWIAFVAPANAHISQWSPDHLAEGWERWRTQWEFAHAARAVLHVGGLALLVQSLLTEIGRHQPHHARSGSSSRAQRQRRFS